MCVCRSRKAFGIWEPGTAEILLSNPADVAVPVLT